MQMDNFQSMIAGKMTSPYNFKDVLERHDDAKILKISGCVKVHYRYLHKKFAFGNSCLLSIGFSIKNKVFKFALLHMD